MKSIVKAATGVLLACGLAVAAPSPAQAAVDFWIGLPPPPPPVIYPVPYYVPPPCHAYGPYACRRLIHYRPYYRYWGPRWWRPARYHW